MTDHEIEMKIVESLINDALAEGWPISVQDGEEITVTRSIDKAEIVDALATTDYDHLIIHTGDAQCWIMLVWGNGVDVISDYSGPDEIMQPLFDRANDVADRYS